MEIGWSMTIETANGIVALQSNLLENSFKLFYPQDIIVPNKMIMETLCVTLSEPITNDLLETDLCPKYYSEKFGKYGRVWIKQEANFYNTHGLYIIKEKHLQEPLCTNSFLNAIEIYDYHFCTTSKSDAQNYTKANMEVYKNKFLYLLVKISKLVGDINAFNLNCGLILHTPEILAQIHYSVIRTQKGCTEYCYAQDISNNFEIMLKSENSLSPWITILRYPSNNELSAQGLLKLLDAFNNFNALVDPLPLLMKL